MANAENCSSVWGVRMVANAHSAGSHLDSQPTGGKFDGALGVMAALEIVRTWLETPFEGGRHIRRIELIDAPGEAVEDLAAARRGGRAPGRERTEGGGGGLGHQHLQLVGAEVGVARVVARRSRERAV